MLFCIILWLDSITFQTSQILDVKLKLVEFFVYEMIGILFKG